MIGTLAAKIRRCRRAVDAWLDETEFWESRNSHRGQTKNRERDDDAVLEEDWLPPEADPTPGVRPEDIDSQADIVQHVGLTPREFVIAVLHRHDGHVPQQAFTRYTDLSESSLSRLLGDLEADEQVERVQLGRQKVVCLPGKIPGDASDITSEPGSETTRQSPQA